MQRLLTVEESFGALVVGDFRNELRCICHGRHLKRFVTSTEVLKFGIRCISPADIWSPGDSAKHTIRE